MPSKVIYERFLWFHNQVKKGLYPNASTLAERFEISPKTAQRNIEFIAERLFAPLTYVHARRGYAYEDNTYELPASWLTADELISLLLSFRLASTVPDSGMKTRMKAFLNQVLSLYTHEAHLRLDRLVEKVSVKNIEYSKTGEKTFQLVVDALLHARPLKIGYHSPHNDESTVRDILPLHLLSYMGTWHIIAHCALRGDLRDFALSRIRSVEPSARQIQPPPGTDSLKDYIRKHFGILNSDQTYEVCLRFSPDVASWISEQVWHPGQKARRDADGSLCLSFPVADLREIAREVLRHGSQVEVISPPALREAVSNELESAARIYAAPGAGSGPRGPAAEHP